ncbi:MAG: ATPase, partial [Spirochaetia bacterium]|nr:ATPase [Spirochaetia bacterium]
RRYLSYLAGRGDSRIFDKTSVTVEEDRLKGVELIFAVNKGRRIFNFEYSLATLVAIMSTATILNNHNIPFGVCGYSDLTNQKKAIDLTWFKRLEESYEGSAEETLFYGLSRDWHGDTVPEHQILDSITDSFSPEARTRLVIMVSDFRGARAKVDMARDLGSAETRDLKLAAERLGKNNVILGVGVGVRALAEHIFHDALQVGGENFANLPSLLAGRLTDIIHQHHTPGSL